jgi:hypothetical protein
VGGRVTSRLPPREAVVAAYPVYRLTLLTYIMGQAALLLLFPNYVSPDPSFSYWNLGSDRQLSLRTHLMRRLTLASINGLAGCRTSAWYLRGRSVFPPSESFRTFSRYLEI